MTGRLKPILYLGQRAEAARWSKLKNHTNLAVNITIDEDLHHPGEEIELVHSDGRRENVTGGQLCGLKNSHVL